MTGRPLLLMLKSIIERSYGMPAVIDDIAPFIIGDAGYLARYGGPEGPGAGVGAPGGSALEGARLLVREVGSSLRVSLYYPDALVRHLERFNPLAGVGDENIEAFAVLIEELDHLLTLASRAAEGRPVSLLELEHHANVTKYFVVLHFLGKQLGRRRVPEPLRQWARYHVLERYAAGEGEEGTRYQDAARLAGKYVQYLESLPVGERPAELRAYQRRSFPETFRLFTHPN